MLELGQRLDGPKEENMAIYKVTAYFYYDVKVKANGEVDAVREAKKAIPNSVTLCDPEDYLVEELSDEEDD